MLININEIDYINEIDEFFKYAGRLYFIIIILTSHILSEISSLSSRDGVSVSYS